MFVSEIFTQAQNAFGVCDDAKVFEAITFAVKSIADQSLLDPNIGSMDICVCNGCVTLPSDVRTVLAVNQNGFPTLIRDQWFQYNVDGPGTQTCIPWQYTQEEGPFVTFRDPSGPVYLVAEIESAADSNKMLRVYASYQGKKVYTVGTSGNPEEGFLVPTVFGFSQPNPDVGPIDTIYRIQKAQTNGFIRLLAVNSDSSPHTLIGYYEPSETVPIYRRIRVQGQNWVRLKYRKKDLEVRSKLDWINIENKEALLLAIKAVKFRKDNQFDQARAAEGEAIRLINNQSQAEQPNAMAGPQIINNDWPNVSGDDSLIYGGYGWNRGGWGG